MLMKVLATIKGAILNHDESPFALNSSATGGEAAKL